MKVGRSDPDLQTIVGRIRDRDIDLQPDFQRGEIWDLKRRQRLIDTILRAWYVPAVHIVQSEDGSPEVVLDGHQRLAAIRDFFENRFPIDGFIEPRNAEIRMLHRMRYGDLPADVRRRVNRFVLTTIILSDHQPEEPSELFFRLNQSYNLTPPEKRNALYGAARSQVKDVVAHLRGVGLLTQEAVGFNNARLAYDDIIARCCIALQQGDLGKHINNTVIESFYREAAFPDSVIDVLIGAGYRLFEMRQFSDMRLRFNKGTLFSWLIFCSWVPSVLGGPLPPDLLQRFESARIAARSRDERPLPEDLVAAIRLYDDRSSYRVTDVSSVLARDIVMYLFLQREYGAPGMHGTEMLLHGLIGVPESEAQNRILAFAQPGRWGVLPASLDA